MRVVLVLLIAAGSVLCARAQEPQPAVDPGPQAAVQQLFDAIASHNIDVLKTLFTPDAALLSLTEDGKPARMRYEEFIGLVATTKNVWLERIWNPTVLVHGPIAVVWANYDFHLNGNLTHCGIDSFSLLKTSTGWKIALISDTRETTGCTSPLGPPRP